MTPDFSIQFVIDRITPAVSILLTDESTGVTNLAGCFLVNYPDGTQYHNTNFLDPDISAPGGTKSITPPSGTDGEVKRGTYTFTYTALDQDTDEILGEVKTFSFSFDEPEIEITNTSDVALPKVAFSVPATLTQTSYTATIDTFEMVSAFPSTSDLDGTEKTATLTMGDRELDHDDNGDYYEGEYNPVVTYIAEYQHNSLAYLSVLYSEEVTAEFLINAAQTSAEVLPLIAAFRLQESCDLEQYNRAMALYAHIEAGAREGVVDAGNGLLSSLLEIIGVPADNDFQAEPISGFIVSSQDLSNYYSKSQVNALLAALEITLQENVTVSVNGGGIGGFAFNELVEAGTPLSDLWVQLLRKGVAATYTSPTLSVAGSNLAPGALIGEVGLTETVTITPTWAQNNAGAITGFSLLKNDIVIQSDTTPPIPNTNYTDSITSAGTYAYKGNAAYNQGAVLNDSLGNPDPSGQIAAGNLNSNTVTYKKVYPWYLGAGSSAPSTSSDILAGTKKVEDIGASIEAAFSAIGPNFLWFAVPSDYNNPKTYTEWEDDADTNNAGEIGGASNLFADPIVISVTTTGLNSNYTIDYDVYITNYKTASFTAILS